MAKDLVNDLYPAVKGRAKTRVTDVQADCVAHIGATQQDLLTRMGMGRMEWLRKDYTLATVAGTHTYDMAAKTTDLSGRSILGFYPDYRPQSPLEERDSGYLFALDPYGTMASNKPVRWAWLVGDDATVKFQPTPDAVYNLYTPYFRTMTIATSASTGDVDWPDEWVDFLIERAAYLARKWNRRQITGIEETQHERHLMSFLRGAAWRPPAGTAHIRPRGGGGLR